MRPIPGNDNFDALAERAFREAVDRGILVDWPAHDPLFVGHFEYCQHDGHGTAWFCRTNPSAWVAMPPAIPNVIRLRIHDTGPREALGPATIIPFPGMQWGRP